MPLSRRLALRLEYDGTAYAGWQRQDPKPTLQAALEEAIRKLTGKPSPVTAAGRTDAGVHAEGQVVHFETRSKLPLDRWLGALNAHLPPDVAVLEAREMRKTFHARFGAKGKTYAYRIWNARGRSALLRHRAWHVPFPLSLSSMRRASRLLEGRHDFRAFSQAASAREKRSTVRTVTDIRISREGDLLTIRVTGDGFLTHMVRTLVGTLVEVGKGKRRPAWVVEVLKSRSRPRAGPTAPAQGLTLERVDYS